MKFGAQPRAEPCLRGVPTCIKVIMPGQRYHAYGIENNRGKSFSAYNFQTVAALGNISSVVTGGLEPPTPRFSVWCSTN